MISSNVAALINRLPDSLVKFISKKIVTMYIKKYADIRLSGFEKVINMKKPVIFVCNHLSNADGLILWNVLKELDVTFIAGVKLSNDPVTNIGMNVVKTIIIKPNSADKEALSNIVQTVKGGNNILIFPEGTRSRTGSLIEAKKGVLLIARLTKVPIVPLCIYGTDKLMPINKDGDMSAEDFHHSEVYVNFGEPFSLEEKIKGEDRLQYEERALNAIMKRIAALLPEDYRGFYK